MTKLILSLFRLIYLCPGKRNDRQIDGAFTLITSYVIVPIVAGAYPLFKNLEANGNETKAVIMLVALIGTMMWGANQFKKVVIERETWKEAKHFGSSNTAIKLTIGLGILAVLVLGALVAIKQWDTVLAAG